MFSIYTGHFAYNKVSILQNAPYGIGIYYCGVVLKDGKLYPAYIGRAKGNGVTICSRLLDHIRDDNWPDITHFGYRPCITGQEAEDLEIQEIRNYNPKYNTQWNAFKTLLG